MSCSINSEPSLFYFMQLFWVHKKVLNEQITITIGEYLRIVRIHLIFYTSGEWNEDTIKLCTFDCHQAIESEKCKISIPKFWFEDQSKTNFNLRFATILSMFKFTKYKIVHFCLSNISISMIKMYQSFEIAQSSRKWKAVLSKSKRNEFRQEKIEKWNGVRNAGWNKSLFKIYLNKI